jgi:type I restriction enzyme S subunit
VVRMSAYDELGQIKKFNFVNLKEVSTGYTKFKNGDVIFAKITPCMENGNCAIVSGLTHNICFGSTEFMVFRAFRKLTAKYLHYFLHNDTFRRNAEPFMRGTAGQKRITSHYMATHCFVLPPAKEQQTITTYLDTKTAEIDRKIELLSQKAAQYGKLKQSLINETVTRGLDKTVAMQDSGVEWIGKVPAHWDVQRIADIAAQNKVKNNGLVEKNLLSLSYGKIIRKDFNTSFGLLPESFETYQVVTAGTVILRLTDLQNDKKSLRVGLVHEQGIITSAYLGLRFQHSIDSCFAYYLLHVYDLCKVFYWFGGGLRSTMRFDDIKVIPFILPPREEQQTIANYLDEKTAHIDGIITTINSQIDKLKELRKTLINDVVIGKIKVA